MFQRPQSWALSFAKPMVSKIDGMCVSAFGSNELLCLISIRTTSFVLSWRTQLCNLVIQSLAQPPFPARSPFFSATIPSCPAMKCITSVQLGFQSRSRRGNEAIWLLDWFFMIFFWNGYDRVLLLSGPRVQKNKSCPKACLSLAAAVSKASCPLSQDSFCVFSSHI